MQVGDKVTTIKLDKNGFLNRSQDEGRRGQVCSPYRTLGFLNDKSVEVVREGQLEAGGRSDEHYLHSWGC